MKKMTRIRWTAEQRQAFELYLVQIVAGMQPGTTQVEVVKQAMDKMPASLRRPISAKVLGEASKIIRNAQTRQLLEAEAKALKIRKPKVTWSADELSALAQDVALQRIAQIRPGLLELIVGAQVNLPEDRRRNIKSLDQVPELVNLIVAAVDDLISGKETHIPVFTEVPTTVNPMTVLQKCRTSELAAVLVERLGSALAVIAPAARDTLEEITRPPVPRELEVKPVDRTRRVLIVGPTKPQFEEIAQRTRGFDLELRWHDKEAARLDIAESIFAAVVQRHTAHRHWDKVTDTLGSKRVRFASGGIESVCHELSVINSWSAV